MVDETFLVSPSLEPLLEGLRRTGPGLHSGLHLERAAMARHLIVQVCADRERALADGTPTYWPTWHDTATGLIDAIVGMWQSPVSS